MTLEPFAETMAAPADTGAPDAEQRVAHDEPRASTAATDEPCRHPALLTQVIRALADPHGCEAGLRRLDGELRQRGPSQFVRFYFEELLGRSPETGELAQRLVLHPSRYIRELLCSNQFMEQHDVVLQQEFAHLSREFFLHVPSAGEAGLFRSLQADPRFCPINVFAANRDAAGAARLAYLRNTVSRLIDPRSEHVTLFGHPDASRILQNNLKRGWDSAFALLREPVDASLCWLDHVLNELCRYPSAPAVAEWRRQLGIADEAFFPDRGAALELIPKVVELLMPSNPMCTILGDEPHLDSALDNAAILDLKIIHFERTDDFLRFRGIPAVAPRNSAMPLVGLPDIKRSVLLQLYDKNEEDLKFYSWVGKHASPGDGPWLDL